MTTDKQQIYLNPMQREVLAIGAKDNVIVAGRGTGKSIIHAAINLRNFQAMPRSTTAIVAPNTKRALTNTLPSMFVHWERWGYRRGLHWEVGRRPPRHLHWPKPLYEPANWDDIISFYNGSIAHIISQDRKGTSNSKSFDFLAIDEAKFINYAQLKDETFPANRGQRQEYGHLPYHHGMLITSDMPLTKEGSWFLNYEKQTDPELIQTLLALGAEIQHFSQLPPTPYNTRCLARCTAQREHLQRHALFYKHYSSLTNLEILGEAFIKEQRRNLPYLVFRTSILCLPVEIIKDGFYSSMTAQHKYTATNTDYLRSLDYDTARLLHTASEIDADLQADQPLCVAFDYNANINWLVVGQPDHSRCRLNILKSFFVKYERKLPELIDDFAAYYHAHPTRKVVFYYDTTALGSNYAVNNEDFAYVITRRFEHHGWHVQPVFIGTPMNHVEKHLLINKGFAGQNHLTPYFNQDNNTDLLVSITTAGVYNGKKDKRGEKLAETEEDRLESRTDGSDAFDTLYIGCERFPQSLFTLPVAADFG